MASLPVSPNPLFPEYVHIKMVVLDFDKTITLKHTRGTNVAELC